MTDTQAAPPIDNPRAIAILIVAWFFFTAEIVAVKALAGDLPIVQILLLRFGTQSLALGFYAGARRSVVVTRRLPLHALRSLLSIASMVLQYAAFAALPLALSTTLSFTQVLFLVALAGLVFREKIGGMRAVATLAGFAGVVVLCRPGAGPIDPMTFAMLGGALAGSCVMALTKLLSRTESAATIMFYVGVFNTLWVAVPGIAVWQTPTGPQAALIALICVAGTLSHFLMVTALRKGDASALAPVDYIRLVFATIAGFALFGEVPDAWTWTGAAIIMGSTLALALAERRARRHADRILDPKASGA